MSRSAIIDKLQKFLREHSPFTEEFEVLYLLVEIRKVLDHENDRTSAYLRFYCDWSVHTEKDRITPIIKKLMEEILEEIKGYIKTHRHSTIQVTGFMYMENLRQEMENFLRQHELPETLTSVGEDWLQFIKLLVQILIDQPINKPCEGINRFFFCPSRPGAVIATFEFETPILGQNSFRYMNWY